MLPNLRLNGVCTPFDYKHAWRFFCSYSSAENREGEDEIGCCEKPCRSWGEKVQGKLNCEFFGNLILLSSKTKEFLLLTWRGPRVRSGRNRLPRLPLGLLHQCRKGRSCVPCWELMLEKRTSFGGRTQNCFPVHDSSIHMYSTGYHVFLLCLKQM